MVLILKVVMSAKDLNQLLLDLNIFSRVKFDICIEEAYQLLSLRER